jgi:phage tail sheath protein FI
MPEYLAPGVFVEEVSYRAKSIEGVSTTTTGIVGPTRYGPVDVEPDIVTSLVEFEATYGDRQRLQFATEDDPTTDLPLMHNYVWHAVRAFFENGGKRLYVERVFRPLVTDGDGNAVPGETTGADGQRLANDGRAYQRIGSDVSSDEAAALSVHARFPGVAGSRHVRITLKRGPNILAGDPGSPKVNGLQNYDVVWVANLGSPPAASGSPPSVPGPGDLAPIGDFYVAESYADAGGAQEWQFVGPGTVQLADLSVNADPRWSDQVRVVTATVTVDPAHPDGISQVWADLPLDPRHEFAGRADSIFAKFAEYPDSLADARTLPLVINHGTSVVSGLDLLNELFVAASAESPPDNLDAELESDTSDDPSRSFDLLLTGGNDGRRPTASEYEGAADPSSTRKTGLVQFEDIDDISIVLAPGSTFGYENGYASDASTILNLLISHAERMRYRIAVLDSGDAQTISQVRAMRSTVDSTYAAFYYPWVRVLDPVTQKEINLPPSGFVAGIYARNDVNRAVYKAPANEVVTLAIGFETMLNKGQQEVLNPEGINAFRFFEGRGYRLWGARTISSDPEWKYVNLRRYFAYLEHSIDLGTQWAVFEPNGELLWANVRRTVSDFLFNEFQMGALLGSKPEEAYFVKCDRSTMTQNDLDNGRLVCLIGVAPLRPAEFVIFRIGQWTASAKT